MDFICNINILGISNYLNVVIIINLWVMGYGNNAVAHRVCACESYATMITQLTDLVTLCTLSSLFAGLPHLQAMKER